jgi:hypothetical protein
VGGYVYRGPIAELNGMYVFGDSSSHQIWAMEIDRDANGGLGAVVPGSLINLSTMLGLQTFAGSSALRGVTSFSEDVDGNLYWMELGGRVSRIIAGAGPTATWNINGSGDWANAGNWSSNFAPANPNGNTHDVIFGGVITSPQTVFLNVAATAKSITFNNANMYAIGGGGVLTLEANSGNASIAVNQGSHLIQAPIMLGSNTNISAAAGTRLDINNSLNFGADGRTLAVSGSGEVYFNNNIDTVANGIVNNSGTVGGTGRINGALNNNGGTVKPGSSTGTLTVDTTFSQSASGTLAIELAGTSAGEFDQLVVGGAATLDGQVSVTLLNGFEPNQGEVFTVVMADSITDNGIALAGGGPSPFYLITGSSELLLAVGVQGDYNRDGTVNAADYTTWRNSLDQNVAKGTGADGDGSGTITRADYDIWKSHYGETFSGFASGSGSLVASVPEPSSFVLLLIGGLFAACLRRQGESQR